MLLTHLIENQVGKWVVAIVKMEEVLFQNQRGRLPGSHVEEKTYKLKIPKDTEHHKSDIEQIMRKWSVLRHRPSFDGPLVLLVVHLLHAFPCGINLLLI